MTKIRKNLSDSDMLVGWQEEVSFETAIYQDDDPAVKRSKTEVKQSKAELHASFLTPELVEKIGKALLEQKLALYKDGLVEYELKVALQGKAVTLTAVPVKAKKNK